MSSSEVQKFSRLFQNTAVARDYVTGEMHEEDINELASHLFFVDADYEYDLKKTPVDNVFAAYEVAVSKLLKEYGLLVIGEDDLGVRVPISCPEGLEGCCVMHYGTRPSPTVDELNKLRREQRLANLMFTLDPKDLKRHHL